MSDINIGEIGEALNDKMDRDGNNPAAGALGNLASSSGADFVVEYQLPTSANGYRWYRLYNSGWLEQGGRTMTANETITFTKAFADVPTMTWGFCTTRSGASYDGEIYFRSVTATQFVSGNRLNDAISPGFMWIAHGVAA